METRTLRVYELNCQGNLAEKIHHLITNAHNKYDIYGFTETSMVQIPSRELGCPGYKIFASNTPDAGKGAAIVLSDRLAKLATPDPQPDKNGDYIALTLQIRSSRQTKKLLIACVYMPTGLDFIATTNSNFKRAQELHATLRRKVVEHDYAIIMGDFNETLGKIDRSYHIEKGEKQGRLMKDTLKKLRDVYRKIHKNLPGYTNITNTKRKDEDDKNLTTEARLDYILTSKNITSLAAAVESKTIQPLDPTAEAHTIATSHLPLTAKLQFTIRTITHKAYKRPTLRTSNIPDKTKQKYIASIEARLTDKTTIEELEATALQLGTRMIGLKGKKRPTRHTKADTKIGKLRSQIAALEHMTAVLKNMATTNEKWTSFVERFAANLPAEAKTPNNLKIPTNDEDRSQRHALFSSLRQALRGQYSLQQAQITQDTTSEGHTNIFREAYRSYMQKYKHGSLDHILTEGEIIDDPKKLHAMLLEYLRDKYKAQHNVESLLAGLCVAFALALHQRCRQPVRISTDHATRSSHLRDTGHLGNARCCIAYY